MIRAKISWVQLFFSLLLIWIGAFSAKAVWMGYTSEYTIGFMIAGFLIGFWLLLENILEMMDRICFEKDGVILNGKHKLFTEFSHGEEITIKRYMNFLGKPRLLRTVKELKLWTKDQESFVFHHYHFKAQDYVTLLEKFRSICPITAQEKEEIS